MKIQAKSSVNHLQKCDSLIVAIRSNTKMSRQLSDLNKLTDGAISRVEAGEQFQAKLGQVLTLSAPKGLACGSLVLFGVGDGKLKSVEVMRDALKALAKSANQTKPELVVCDFSAALQHSDPQTVCRHAVEAFADVRYRYQKQPKAARDPKPAKALKLCFQCVDKKQMSAAKSGAQIGLAISNGKTSAKDLGNMPGNVCTPTFLASRARKLGRSHNLKVKVLSEKDMGELGMGSLLSVSKGSREPAKLIIMEYFGAKNKKAAPHALVGKGLTFDAGGISLKPSGKMDEMKYDMCGAASVFGAIQAAAELKLPINIVGVVPSSENLPDGIANKPGDVVTSMSGQTIEILNTDAEGRLILCDALTYTKRFKPATVVDIATLTGAVIVALGHQTCGVMGNDQGVVDDLLAAGETSLDFAWQLPIKETYKKQLKSDYADLANIGGPSAGTITAACFLSYFTEDFKWAHLDIAGTAWGGSEGKRASGRAVPILTQYLIDQSQSA